MGNWVTISTAGASGYTPPPAAPNITSASCSAYYGLFGNLSAYGLQGTVTLPTGDAAYGHLKEIDISATFQDGSSAPVGTPLYASFSGSTVTFKTPCSLPQADATQPVVLTFTVKNDAGIATASPVSVTVTVGAALVSTLPAVDASTLSPSNSEYHARFQDSATALHTVINTHVSMANAQYPQTATLWINKQDGNGALWQGWWRIAGAAQLVQIGLPDSNTAVYPPGGASDGSWLLIGAAGAIPKEAGVPSSAVTSSAFTVPTIPAPASNAATGAWIDQINYGNNGQVNTWGWKNLFTTLPYGDPNFFFGRWTVQNGSLVGGVFTPGTALNFAQHDGAEVAFSDDDNGGNGATVLRMPGTNLVSVTNPLMWTLPAYKLADGSLNPNSCFRFRNYVGSRRNTDGSGGTLTQQGDWSSGVGVSSAGTADHLDVVLDLTKAQIQGRQLAAASVDSSAIASVNASAVLGTFAASYIASVSASTINGTIYASSIGSVNASVINGTFYASSIGSVNANVVNGTFYASSIGSVNAATITGMVNASSIASVNASVINGTLYASSIGSVNASVVNGTFYASSIGSVNAATIAGVLYASSIGSVNASTINGTFAASSIGSVNASVINGSLYASSIASVSATTINGLIVTSQIADGIMNSLGKFAAGLSVVQRVTSLPATTGLPDGALALLTTPTPARLYQIVTGAWTLVTASTAITGQLQATDIANIQASQINGLILAAQISQINASQINGSIYASSIASVNAAAIAVVNATAIAGSLYASSIASVNASALKGSLYASSIASVGASSIAGSIYASSIASVSATVLTGSIYASSIASIAASVITGTVYASSIASVTASSITVVAGAAGTIGVGSGGLTFQGTGGINFSDGAGHSGAIVWQTLTAGYGVGVNTNFSVNGSMYSSGNYWCGTQVSANTLAIYNSGVGTLNVVDNNFIFVGRGVNCPDYGIACSGVNPKVGGVQKYGATYALQYVDWNGINQTAHVNGGVVTTG